MISVPPIDFAQACGPDRAGRHRQFELLDTALSTVGYVRLDAHGITPSAIAALLDVTHRFFDQPDAMKSAVAQPSPEQVRGWSGVGSEGIAYSLDEESHGDLKEKMDIGPIDGPVLGEAGAAEMAFPNLWPQHPAGFRELWEDHYRQMQRVCAGLLALTAEGFGLARDHFVGMFDREMSMLRALHYPPQLETPFPYQYRAGTHTDYGAFTIVCAESTTGGLQVFDRDGEWLDVSTAPTSLVVLVGDLLAEWTGNRWSATVHRTANPPLSVGFGGTRLAFAYYQHPNFDTAVQELPPLRGPVTGPRQELIAGRHLMEKYVRQTTFGRSAARD
ncbi:MAG: 2-oxoglutarate and iron-dependent oxygenase domain-containing protein [Mycobacterium sp.]